MAHHAAERSGWSGGHRAREVSMRRLAKLAQGPQAKVSAEFGLAQAGQGEFQASPGGGFKSLLYGGLCRLLSRTAWL